MERLKSLLILPFWNKNVKCVFIDRRQKTSTDKSKQTSTFLDILSSDESSFKYLLPHVSLSINRRLEMWLGLLTFYLRNINFYINFPRQQPCVEGFRLNKFKVRKRNSLKNYEWELWWVGSSLLTVVYLIFKLSHQYRGCMHTWHDMLWGLLHYFNVHTTPSPSPPW